LKAHEPDHQPGLHRHQGRAEFKDKTTALNQLWQTDFTYLKVIGLGWCLSTILDDHSRYIICVRRCVAAIIDKLELALAASGCHSAKVAHKP
jgi:transposase InsO family protein